MLDRIKAGSAAGLAAGIAVMALILVYDLARLEPLATPGLLAGNVLGVPQPIETSAGLGALAWLSDVMQAGWALALYTVVHFAVFIGLGIGAAFVFHPTAVAGTVLTGALYGALAGSAVFYAGVELVAPAFVGTPDWRLILAANAIAGVVMVSQLVELPEAEA